MCMVAQTTYVVTAKSLRVRQMPSAEAMVLGSINQGTEVNVISIIDDWAIITYKDQTAYTSAAYLVPKVKPTTPNDESEFASVETTPNDASEFATANITPNNESQYAISNFASTMQQSYQTPAKTSYVYGRSFLGVLAGYSFQNFKGLDKVFHGYTLGMKVCMEINDHNFGIYGGAHNTCWFQKDDWKDKTFMHDRLIFDLGPSVAFDLGQSAYGALYCAPAGLCVDIFDKEYRDAYKVKVDVLYTCGFGACISIRRFMIHAAYNLYVSTKEPINGKYYGGQFEVMIGYNSINF